MNRKRYEHKMMNLIKAIHEYSKAHGKEYSLGQAMAHLHKADLKEGLEAAGSYKAMWDNLKECREIFGVN